MADGLEETFPPLRTAEAGLIRNAPLYHTSFIGRTVDLDEIAALLSGTTRLLTLVGQGGAGKTRLAVEATIRSAPDFANGAVFCHLAAVDSEDLIVQTLIDALGFAVDTHSSGLEPLTQVLDYLRTRRIIVLLDNFEHLLGAAGLVGRLLDAGPGVTVLVTSRERLRLADETVYAVGGLDESDDQAHFSHSTELFSERARQVDSGFDPDADQDSIRRVGSALDGLPLGIELAAAWVDVLTPREIAQEIESSLDFLESQERDRDARHTSLRAVFDSSWSRLTDEQQRVLSRLSIFKGGFDREAAGAVAFADLRTMSTLVAKSLVRRLKPGRFDLHPLIAEFSGQILDEGPEHDEVSQRHAVYYIGLLASQQDNLDSSAQGDAAELLQEDVSNVRIALLATADRGGEAEVLGILEAAFLFYLAHSWHEGLEVFSELIDRTAARSDDGFDARMVSGSAAGVIS
jgi:predicted ATPase